MGINRSKLRNSKLQGGTGIAALALGLIATPAFAQITPQEQNANPVPSDNATNPALQPDTANEAIVVTGSRIQNPNLTEASPVAVISESELELRQTVTIEQTLRQIPGVVPGIGSQVNNGNGGDTTLNLRGLGSNRNLTLLNGTRLVPANLAGVVNIDVIPVALLQRVDVLTGGAGATYGADAIAGVVNFITRTDFEGATLNVSNQITEQGDGHTLRADLTVGGNFQDGRGNATLSVGYTNRKNVLQGDRDFGFLNLSSTTGAAGGSSTTVPTVITVPGTTSGTLQVSPGGNSLVPYNRPFNFNPFNLFQLPLKQYRLFGSANYEVTEFADVYGEGLFVQNTTRTEIAPSGTFRNVLQTPLSNPFLPAGIRNQICGLDTDRATPGVQRLYSQAVCDAAATATDPSDPNYRQLGIDFGRRFVEFGSRLNEYETRLFQLKAGVRGALTETLNYDVFGTYGESTNNSRQSGNGTLTRLQQSLLSTNATSCLDPSGGCVPINLFGQQGSIGPDVQAFLDVGNVASTSTSLGQVQAVINGDLGFALPTSSDPVGIALGVEYRDYYAETRSDLLTQTPDEVLGNGAANPDTQGSYDVRDVFGELAIPLFSDVSFLENFLIQLGARYSDYSTTGDAFTWRAGGSFEPVYGVTVRGGYQRVTRSPNIGELFAVPVVGLDNFTTDPCAGAAPVNNAALAATCLAQGAPANSIGSIIVDPAGQVNVTAGGNPNLDVENAYTWTVGGLLQPSFLPGFALTVDYYNIVIRDAITSPTIGDVFAACFGPGLTGTGSPTDPACTSIRRNPATGNLFGSSAAGGLPLVLTNQGRLQTDGIDATLSYARRFGEVGLNLFFQGNWTNTSKFQANQDDPDSLNRDCVGYYSINCGSIQPEFSFNQRTTISVGDADFSLLWRYISPTVVEPLENLPGSGSNVYSDGTSRQFLEDYARIGDEHYFDITGRFRVLENFTFIASVQNLLDNQPKVVGSSIGSTAFNSGNVYPSSYDPLGRLYAITAQLTF